jgi:exodeoxyribonuclease VII small subunit
VPLAELLAKFEDGNKLLKVCEARLKDAEMKIEQLKKQNDGIALTPFAPEKDSE